MMPSFKCTELNRRENIEYVEEIVTLYLRYRLSLFYKWNMLVWSLKRHFMNNHYRLMHEGMRVRFSESISAFALSSNTYNDFSENEIVLPGEWRMYVLQFFINAGLAITDIMGKGKSNDHIYHIEFLPCVLRGVIDDKSNAKKIAEKGFDYAASITVLTFGTTIDMVGGLIHAARPLFLGKVRTMAVDMGKNESMTTPKKTDNGWLLQYPRDKVTHDMANLFYYGICGLETNTDEQAVNYLTLPKQVRDKMMTELIMMEDELL